MNPNPKMVKYEDYCKTCKHEKVKDYENPCDECLYESVRLDGSRKPVNWEEKEE